MTFAYSPETYEEPSLMTTLREFREMHAEGAVTIISLVVAGFAAGVLIGLWILWP